MTAEVMLNQDSILDFPKGPHILGISHLEYQSWISVYTFEFQNDHVVASPANQLAKCSCYDVISQSTISNIFFAYFRLQSLQRRGGMMCHYITRCL